MSSKSKAAESERRARSEQMKAEREAAARASERRTRLLIALAVVAALILVGVAVVASQSSSGENAAVPTGVEAPGGGAPYGDAAPVVLDEWVDFACPACKTFNDALSSTISEQVEAGELQVYYHPLSFINAGSVRAANAFGCAVDEGLTHEYYDAVFAEQGDESGDGYTNEQLVAIGDGLGAGDGFESCVNGGDYDGWVDNVTTSGADQGVTGTPTIFLNGEVVDLPSYEPQALLDAIEAAAAAE